MPEELLELLETRPDVYWLVLFVLGCGLFILAGFRLLRHWFITLLFAAATAGIAFLREPVLGKEWTEVILYGVVWLATAVVFYTAESHRARRHRRKLAEAAAEPEPADTPLPEAPTTETPVPETVHRKQRKRGGSKSPRPIKTGDVVDRLRQRPAQVDIQLLDAPLDPSLAAVLLHRGMVADGRKALKSLCSVPNPSLDALALAAFDCMRPPEDRETGSECLRRLQARIPDCCEVESIYAIDGLTHRDYDELGAHYWNLLDGTIVTKVGYSLALIALLGGSDFQMQSRFRSADGITEALVNSTLKGTAQLLLRRHEAAWKTFERGKENADRFPRLFSEGTGIRVPRKQERALVDSIRLECSLGKALVLADAGLYAEARRCVDEVALTEYDVRLPHYWRGFKRECSRLRKLSSARGRERQEEMKATK